MKRNTPANATIGAVLGLAVAAAITGVAAADFSGYYDVENWSFFTEAEGSLDSSEAPEALTLIGGDLEIPGDTTLTIEVEEDCNFRFDWEYHSNNSPGYDVGGYIVGDTYYELDDGSGPGSGSISVAVSAGETIGFYVYTMDGMLGAGALLIQQFMPARFAFVDPNPKLIHKYGTNVYEVIGAGTDATNKALAENGRVIQAVAADGVTRVLIRYPAPKGGTVKFKIRDEAGKTTDVGSLYKTGKITGTQMVQDIAINTVKVGDQEWAFAVLIAPPDFARGTGDYALSERTIKLIIEQAGEEDVEEPLKLYRPPVVLLHGEWSKSTDWTWGWTAGDNRFTVSKHSYLKHRWKSLSSNIEIPKTAITNGLAAMRTAKNAAVTQADVFTHGMGGLLARKWITHELKEDAKEGYFRKRNFGKGDIHKLITVDSPHLGSAFESKLLVEKGGIWKPSIFGKKVNKLYSTRMAAVEPRVQDGAFQDLRLGSSAITNQKEAEAPSHAIVGTGGEKWGKQARIDRMPFLVGRIWQYQMIEEKFPSKRPHDVVSNVKSQRGGLVKKPVKPFPFEDNAKPGIHISLTKEERVGNWAVGLLNARTTDTKFAKAFPKYKKPKGAAPSPPAPPMSPPAMPLASGGIIITSPPPGTVFMGGESIDVVIESVDGFIPERVLAISFGAADYVTEAPFIVTLDIPVEALGATFVTAYAMDTEGAEVESEEIPIEIATSATLLELEVSPQPLRMYDFVVADYLEVTGMYSDGVGRGLTSPDLGTVYESADSSIVIVDEWGSVRSVAVGETSITVSNGSISTEVDVVVESVFDQGEDPTILFVRSDAPDGGDGLSWTLAYRDLLEAMEVAATIDTISEVWVAEGTYTPAPPGGNRYASFELVDGLTIYGGFRGTETSLVERDVDVSKTILSGDLNGDDVGGVHDPSRAENSLHVVLGEGTGATAVLDGFIITGGNADGADIPDNRAGGMYLPGSSATVRNCRFEANTAGAAGGGAVFVVDDGAPVFIDCQFIGNYGYYGGALNFISSSPILLNCYIYGNDAAKGAGLAESYSSPLFVNTIFANNNAEILGGAINNHQSQLTLINCTIADNTAASVGGLRVLGDGSGAALGNCILWGNSDESGSGQAAQIGFAYPASPEDTFVDYSCVQGWTGEMQSIGSFGDDPLFTDATVGDYRLSAGSPCIDAADNTTLPDDVYDLDGDEDTFEPIPFDLGGYERLLDDPATEDTGYGDAPIVDIGAHEFLETDFPGCPGDIDADGVVDVLDLLAVLAAWGQSDVPEDINGDGMVDVLDLLEILSAWGPCP